MIIIGFIQTNSKIQALELFKDICIQNGLKVGDNLINKYDIVITEINYEEFFIEKYKFLNFDIIIFDNYGIMEEKIKDTKKNSLYENILVVNFDDKKIFKLLSGFKAKLITFGLNGKSCITVSSIQNCYDIQEIECCIQRTIPTFTGNKIEAQEFKLTLKKYKENDIYNSLAAISLAIICGIEIQSIEKIAL